MTHFLIYDSFSDWFMICIYLILVARTADRSVRQVTPRGSVCELPRADKSSSPVDPAEILSRWETDNLGEFLRFLIFAIKKFLWWHFNNI